MQNVQKTGLCLDQLHTEVLRAICIDIDDTLLDFTACSTSCMKLGFKEMSLPWKDGYEQVFLQINQGLWDQIEHGTLSMEQLKKTRWNLVFQAMGIEGDGVAFETIFRKHLYNSHEPVLGALEAVYSLKSRFPLYIVSNGEHEQQVNRLHLAGLLDSFQDVFTSERMQAKKPDPAFFVGVLNHMRKDLPDLQPHEILLIGDSLHADVQGALRSGFQAIHFCSPVSWQQIVDLLLQPSKED